MKTKSSTTKIPTGGKTVKPVKNFKNVKNLTANVSKKRTYRNLLQEKRAKALKDYLQERRIQRGLVATSLIKKLRKKRTLPVLPSKSMFVILKSKNKIIYDRKLLDYKNRGLLQEYISFDGKILPRRKTGITTKQQRYLTKAIKTARILGLLPFVKKEKGFF